jgi:hypothetical protein
MSSKRFWFFGIGWLLRADRRVLGIVNMILGVASGLDSLGTLHLFGLYVYWILAPIWALWLGIDRSAGPCRLSMYKQGEVKSSVAQCFLLENEMKEFHGFIFQKTDSAS